MAVFVFLCMLVAITNLLSQMVFVQTKGFSGNAVLILIYAVLAVVVFFVYRRGTGVSTLATYLIQAPVMLTGIFMGTVFDPGQPAVTFMLFIVTLPLFILDKPWRVVLYESCSALLFVLLCFAVKEYDVIKYDLVHVVGFYISTVAITLFLLADRFDAIEGYAYLHRASEHDELTGLKNRRALNNDRDTYLRMPVCVAMVDIDFFKRFNDTYGHDKGDEVIQFFASVLESEFGHEFCYRYGGDEVLVIVRDWEAADFEAAMARCKQAFDAYAVEGEVGCLRFSCGYVHGQARNQEEFTDMGKLADDLLYQAKSKGRNIIIGQGFVPSPRSVSAVLGQ